LREKLDYFLPWAVTFGQSRGNIEVAKKCIAKFFNFSILRREGFTDRTLAVTLQSNEAMKHSNHITTLEDSL
jgi:hypothetical protein